MPTRDAPACPALTIALMVLDPRNSFEGGVELGTDLYQQIADRHRAGLRCPKCPAEEDLKDAG